jgi:hypothetical protein
MEKIFTTNGVPKLLPIAQPFAMKKLIVTNV